MNLGGAYNPGRNIPENTKTNSQLLTEQNKNLRKLTEKICCLVDKDFGTGGGTTIDYTSLLNQLITLLTSINQEVERGAACTDPQFVEICNQLDISDLQTALDAINTNTDNLETLIIASNSLLTTIKTNLDALITNTANTVTELQDLQTQLTQVDTNHIIVDNLPVNVFQIADCNGNNIGLPQEVVKVITLNKQIVYLCNIQEIVDAINSSNTQYNNVAQQEAVEGDVRVVPANTVHSISYKILEGSVIVEIADISLTYQAGEADMEEANGLIQQVYRFTPLVGGRVKIKTIF